MEPEQIRLNQIAVGSSPSLENAKSNLDTLNLVWGISIGNPFTGNCHSLITILHATPVINSSGFLGIWWPRSTPVGSSPASVRVHTSQFSLSSATMIAHTETSSLRQHPPLWNYFLAPLRMYNKMNGFFAFRQFSQCNDKRRPSRSSWRTNDVCLRCKLTLLSYSSNTDRLIDL